MDRPSSFTFFLGTHKPEWLAQLEVPLFVSRRTLARLFELPRAKCPWALDSGGFSELSLFGRWTVPAAQYIREVRQFIAEIGCLAGSCQQDWMCEPEMIEKTGLSVSEHQRRTVNNFLLLKDKAADLPGIPVLQGWTRDQYLRCLDLFDRAGVDLRQEARVGLGSVCRRQDTDEAEQLITELAGLGLNLHAFGFSTRGLERSYEHLVSSDSMAWSLIARNAPPLSGCSHRRCNNCSKFALRWRASVRRAVQKAVKARRAGIGGVQAEVPHTDFFVENAGPL